MLQFLQLLTLLILLLNYRLNSSSSLRMKMLTLEEPLIHSTGVNFTDFSILATTLLTGYASFTRYTDATCTVVRYSDSVLLNDCSPWFNGKSYRSYHNSTHFIGIEYSDYSCTKEINAYISYSPSRVCDDDYTSASITASLPTIVSTKTLLSAT